VGPWMLSSRGGEKLLHLWEKCQHGQYPRGFQESHGGKKPGSEKRICLKTSFCRPTHGKMPQRN
jgi:hypothetical protein